jgi:hypothetical protein
VIKILIRLFLDLHEDFQATEEATSGSKTLAIGFVPANLLSFHLQNTNYTLQLVIRIRIQTPGAKIGPPKKEKKIISYLKSLKVVFRVLRRHI